MHILSRLRLRTKLAILMGLSALALVASIGVAASLMRQRMFDDRIDKLRAVVQTTHRPCPVAGGPGRRRIGSPASRRWSSSATQSMSCASTQGRAISSPDPRQHLRGAWRRPQAGRQADIPGQGRERHDRSRSLIAEALRDGDHGVVSYAFLRPGQTQPQPKIAYVARFAPWSLVFTAGAYTDDLTPRSTRYYWNLTAVGGVILLVSLLVAWLINRDIAGSLGA